MTSFFHAITVEAINKTRYFDTLSDLQFSPYVPIQLIPVGVERSNGTPTGISRLVCDSPVVDLDTSGRGSSPTLAVICNFLLLLKFSVCVFFLLLFLGGVVLFFSLSAYRKILIEVSP